MCAPDQNKAEEKPGYLTLTWKFLAVQQQNSKEVLKGFANTTAKAGGEIPGQFEIQSVVKKVWELSSQNAFLLLESKMSNLEH